MFLPPIVVPAEGTYTVSLDPTGQALTAVSVRVHNVPSDATTDLIPGAGAVTVDTTAPGKNVAARVPGTVGQRVAVKVSDSTYTSTTVRLVDPDGNVLGSLPASSAATVADAVTLPVTGDYAVLLDPPGRQVGSVRLEVLAVPADRAYAIALNGPDVDVELDTPTQRAVLTFTATAAGRSDLFVYSATSPVYAVTPIGAGTVTKRLTQAGFRATVDVPAPGTYEIVLYSTDPRPGRWRVGLFDRVSPPATVTHTANSHYDVDGPDGVYWLHVRTIQPDGTGGGTSHRRLKRDTTAIDYEFDELDELAHAYAITIHRSQGSEYLAVVIPLTTSAWMMLQRNLLYTALTWPRPRTPASPGRPSQCREADGARGSGGGSSPTVAGSVRPSASVTVVRKYDNAWVAHVLRCSYRMGPPVIAGEPCNAS